MLKTLAENYHNKILFMPFAQGLEITIAKTLLAPAVAINAMMPAWLRSFESARDYSQTD